MTSRRFLTRRWLPVVVVVGLVLSAPVVAPAAAQQESAESGLVVTLAPDGSADVSVRLTYDLGTDAERAAFRTLQTDDEAKATARDRFRDRMIRLANDIDAVTDREVTVTDTAIDLATTPSNETGIVDLSATVTSLAETRGDRLVLSEPFASGYEPDRAVHVRAPDGYVIVDATPRPDRETADAVSWNAGTDLEGFAVVMAPSDTASSTTTGDTVADEPTTTPSGQDGFGFAGLVLGLALGAGLLVRRNDAAD